MNNDYEILKFIEKRKPTHPVKAQQTLRRINAKRCTSRHFIVKILIVKDKQKMLKPEKKK